MPASVQVEYNQSFLLSEENLVKVDEFIRNRTSDIPEFKLEYQVYRSDHALITYSNPSDVTSEQNNLAESIEALRIKGESEPAKVDLRFHKKNGTLLTVNFDDRDRALLLAADLKSYTTSEILRSRITNIIKFVESRHFIFIVFTAVMPIMLLYIWCTLPGLPSIDNAGATDTERLKFLVETTRSRSELQFIFPAFFFPISAIVFAVLLPYILKLLLMPSTFYWGKEIKRYDKRVGLRSKLFWVGFVGLVISVIASFVYAGLPKP